jgi:hypothetical protein
MTTWLHKFVHRISQDLYIDEALYECGEAAIGGRLANLQDIPTIYSNPLDMKALTKCK